MGTSSAPSIASDAYALGVTIYQCLTGRLPDADAIRAAILGDEAATAAVAGGAASSAIGGSAAAAPAASASASASAALAAPRSVRFAAPAAVRTATAFPHDFPPLAEDLVRRLLHPDPAARLGGGSASGGGFADILAHPWFAPLGGREALEALYSRTGPKPSQGMAGPPPDPSWSRRHYSSIWAPLPKAYASFAEGGGTGEGGAGAPPAKRRALGGSDGGGGGRLARSSTAAELTLEQLVRLDTLPPLPP
jgi:serine/threonine protein kinase